MSLKKDKALSIEFLKCLSKIKGWDYHAKIEADKKSEIRQFVTQYILKRENGADLHEKISYNRLSFLVNHPAFNHAVKALLILLEISTNEKDFNERFEKVTT